MEQSSLCYTVGFLLVYCVCVCVLVNQSCLTLCDPWTVAHKILCPWNSPGKNTGVGSHSLGEGNLPKLLRAKLCPTLCNTIDGSPPSSPIPGILQARTLEWVAISFSNMWKWKVNVKSLSCVRLLATPWTAAYQAPPSLGVSRQEY